MKVYLKKSVKALWLLSLLSLRLSAAETVVTVAPGERHLVAEAENVAQTVFLLGDGAALAVSGACLSLWIDGRPSRQTAGLSGDESADAPLPANGIRLYR